MTKSNRVPADDKRTKPAVKAAKGLYRLMRDNQRLFVHPKTPKLPKDQWATIAWNAAWMAAEAVDGRI